MPKIKPRFYRMVYRFARRFGCRRLENWSYLNWYRSYGGSLNGYFRFTEDFLNCKFDFDSDDKIEIS